MEIWKAVPDYNGLYEASSMGRVRSIGRTVKHPRNENMLFYRKGRILKWEFDKYGYPVVTLSKDGRTKTHKVHRLVASAFIPNPNNLPQIDHINNRKYDNRPENLRWCTTQQNTTWRDEFHRPKVVCKETNKAFSSSYEAAAWVIKRGLKSKKGIQTTNYKTVARSIRDACRGVIGTAYTFHWAYLEGSTTISKESREKSRNGGPRDGRVKI